MGKGRFGWTCRRTCEYHNHRWRLEVLQFLKLTIIWFSNVSRLFDISGDYTSPAYRPLTPTKYEYLNDLYSYNHRCSSYGKTCKDKRNKCQEYASNYYSTAYEIEKYDHYDCMNNTWTGTSYVDPRPTGDDKYIDYLYGYPTPQRPSHGHYGRLPIMKIQDPTYEEVRSIMEGIRRCYSIRLPWINLLK